MSRPLSPKEKIVWTGNTTNDGRPIVRIVPKADELTRLREVERLAGELAIEVEPYISAIPKLRDKARTLKAKIEENQK